MCKAHMTDLPDDFSPTCSALELTRQCSLDITAGFAFPHTLYLAQKGMLIFNLGSDDHETLSEFTLSGVMV